MVKLEANVHTYGGDPNLSGRDFRCAGSDRKEYPINRGEPVGSEVRFATTDINNNIIQDRSSEPLRGCVHYDDINGTCGIGKRLCPVSSVVSSQKFIVRLLELRKLKAVHQTY